MRIIGIVFKEVDTFDKSLIQLRQSEAAVSDRLQRVQSMQNMQRINV